MTYFHENSIALVPANTACPPARLPARCPAALLAGHARLRENQPSNGARLMPICPHPHTGPLAYSPPPLPHKLSLIPHTPLYTHTHSHTTIHTTTNTNTNTNKPGNERNHSKRRECPIKQSCHPSWGPNKAPFFCMQHTDTLSLTNCSNQSQPETCL